MIRTEIDRRYPDAGFVMVTNGHRERRLVYNRVGDSKRIRVAVSNWGDLTPIEAAAALKALRSIYPERDGYQFTD